MPPARASAKVLRADAGDAVVASGHPVGRAFAAVTLRMRHVAVELEPVSAAQMPGVVADREPHLAANDERAHRERMPMGLEHDIGLPLPLEALVEALGSRIGFELVERDSVHGDLLGIR